MHAPPPSPPFHKIKVTTVIHNFVQDTEVTRAQSQATTEDPDTSKGGENFIAIVL